MSTKPVNEVAVSELVQSSHCDANSLTDSYGLSIQVLLAGFAFASLILKRLYCEPPERRRTWTIWFYDTSKQAVGAGVIHVLNVFLAQILHQKRGDPCTWYVVSFLLDSTIGLLVVYACVRLITRLASWKKWTTLKFGEYGQPPNCKAWFHQCAVFVGIIILEKIVVTIVMEFRFWRNVRQIILSPITNPKLEVTIVMLIIPFFVNTLIFWVVDNFTMRKGSIYLISDKKSGTNGKSSKSIRNYVSGREGKEEEDSECGERLLQDCYESVNLETVDNESETIKEDNAGSLSKRGDVEEGVYLRLNSVSF